MLKKLCILSLLAFLAVACRPDVQPARWDLDTLTPILSSRIDINDLRIDTNITVGNDGALSLVFREKLADLTPGRIAPPFNAKFFNTVNIQEIKLGNRVIEEELTLGQLAAQGGVTGAVIIASHGTNQPIPPLTNLGPASFTVDATDYFTSLTLRDGWLILRLENGFPIEITNLQYQIANQGAGTPILQNSLASLPAGAVHYDSVRLQNNFFISGQLEATLINMDSPGSNGNPVPVDTSDAIGLRLTINKLDPVAATAIFPAQDLVQDTGTANLMAPSARLTSVHVEKGTIYLDAVSTIEDQISLDYKIPGAIKSGLILEFNELIPPAPVGGESSRRREVPVDGYDIDLTGLPGAMNVFNEFYTVFLARVDSSGRLINLSLQDSVFIETGIENLEANRGYGFLGYDSIYTQESTSVEELADIRSGHINLNDAFLSLEIDNYIGTEFTFNLQSFTAKKGNTSRSLSWPFLGDNLLLSRATENSPGQRPSPGRSVFPLSNANSNVADLLEIRPDSFDIDLQAFMNLNASPNDLSQFLYTDYGVQAYLNAEIPLNLSLQDLVVGDTNTFNYSDLDPDYRLQGGQLRLVANNFYPFSASARLVLFNNGDEVLDTLSGSQAILPALTDDNQRAVTAVESTITLPLDAATITKLRNTAKILFLVTFNTPHQPETVKFYSDNYLDIQLIGDLSLRSR